MKYSSIQPDWWQHQDLLIPRNTRCVFDMEGIRH